jgi:hypothetical protein
VIFNSIAIVAKHTITVSPPLTVTNHKEMWHYWNRVARKQVGAHIYSDYEGRVCYTQLLMDATDMQNVCINSFQRIPVSNIYPVITTTKAIANKCLTVGLQFNFWDSLTSTTPSQRAGSAQI